MGGVVVDDQVHVELRGNLLVDVPQKRQELPVPVTGLANKVVVPWRPKSSSRQQGHSVHR